MRLGLLEYGVGLVKTKIPQTECSIILILIMSEIGEFKQLTLPLLGNELILYSLEVMYIRKTFYSHVFGHFSSILKRVRT